MATSSSRIKQLQSDSASFSRDIALLQERLQRNKELSDTRALPEKEKYVESDVTPQTPQSLSTPHSPHWNSPQRPYAPKLDMSRVTRQCEPDASSATLPEPLTTTSSGAEDVMDIQRRLATSLRARDLHANGRPAWEGQSGAGVQQAGAIGSTAPCGPDGPAPDRAPAARMERAMPRQSPNGDCLPDNPHSSHPGRVYDVQRPPRLHPSAAADGKGGSRPSQNDWPNDQAMRVPATASSGSSGTPPLPARHEPAIRGPNQFDKDQPYGRRMDKGGTRSPRVPDGVQSVPYRPRDNGSPSDTDRERYQNRPRTRHSESAGNIEGRYDQTAYMDEEGNRGNRRHSAATASYSSTNGQYRTNQHDAYWTQANPVDAKTRLVGSRSCSTIPSATLTTVPARPVPATESYMDRNVDPRLPIRTKHDRTPDPTRHEQRRSDHDETRAQFTEYHQTLSSFGRRHDRSHSVEMRGKYDRRDRDGYEERADSRSRIRRADGRDREASEPRSNDRHRRPNENLRWNESSNENQSNDSQYKRESSLGSCVQPRENRSYHRDSEYGPGSYPRESSIENRKIRESRAYHREPSLGSRSYDSRRSDNRRDTHEYSNGFRPEENFNNGFRPEENGFRPEENGRYRPEDFDGRYPDNCNFVGPTLAYSRSRPVLPSVAAMRPPSLQKEIASLPDDRRETNGNESASAILDRRVEDVNVRFQQYTDVLRRLKDANPSDDAHQQALAAIIEKRTRLCKTFSRPTSNRSGRSGSGASGRTFANFSIDWAPKSLEWQDCPRYDDVELRNLSEMKKEEIIKDLRERLHSEKQERQKAGTLLNNTQEALEHLFTENMEMAEEFMGVLRSASNFLNDVEEQNQGLKNELKERTEKANIALVEMAKKNTGLTEKLEARKDRRGIMRTRFASVTADLKKMQRKALIEAA